MGAEKVVFDYAKAVAELEEIAAKVEDASTSIDDVDRYIKRTKELVEACRQYLRSNRETLTESKALSMPKATTLCVVFEILGGNLGMLFWGWATDRFFKSKAHHTCVVCMVGVSLCVIAFWLLPVTAAWWVMLIPFTLLGVCAAQHATNRASATANGILGIFGYLSTIVSGFGFGYVAQHYGWNAAYITIFVCALIGLALVSTIWTAKTTGYADENLHPHV